MSSSTSIASVNSSTNSSSTDWYKANGINTSSKTSDTGCISTVTNSIASGSGSSHQGSGGGGGRNTSSSRKAAKYIQDNAKEIAITTAVSLTEATVDALSIIVNPSNAVRVAEKTVAKVNSAFIRNSIVNQGAGNAAIGNLFPANGTFSTVMKREYAEAIAIKGSLVGKDEFWITAADDMSGITTKQGAAERLTLINKSGGLRTEGDAILNFNLSDYSGIASPINRTNPGFVPGGLTGGGAREWVIPGNTSIINPTIIYLK